MQRLRSDVGAASSTDSCARFDRVCSNACQLDAGRGSYEVCVPPHWDPSSAVIERFDGATPALLRHEQLAGRLREAGWMVVDHVAATHLDAAA